MRMFSCQGNPIQYSNFQRKFVNFLENYFIELCISFFLQDVELINEFLGNRRIFNTPVTMYSCEYVKMVKKFFIGNMVIQNNLKCALTRHKNFIPILRFT